MHVFQFQIKLVVNCSLFSLLVRWLPKKWDAWIKQLYTNYLHMHVTIYSKLYCGTIYSNKITWLCLNLYRNIQWVWLSWLSGLIFCGTRSRFESRKYIFVKGSRTLTITKHPSENKFCSGPKWYKLVGILHRSTREPRNLFMMGQNENLYRNNLIVNANVKVIKDLKRKRNATGWMIKYFSNLRHLNLCIFVNV